MSTTLCNLSFINNVYTVTSSNPSGTLTVNQPTTAYFNLQYSPWIGSSFTHDYSISVRDATSNITASLLNSNLSIANQSSNLFTVPITPYLTSNAFNTLRLNRQDNFLQVNLNNTAIVRITSSNELTSSYDNSFIRVTASNAGQFSNVIFQPVATVDTPMQFNQPIKALSLSCSNVSSCNIANLSNQLYITNDTAYHASNVAFWGSNAFVSFSNLIQPLAVYGSNTAVYGSNIAVYGSNTAVYGSNTAVYGSNTAVYTSNAFISFSNLIEPLAVYGSNSATYGSNQSVLNASNSLVLSNNLVTLSNYTFSTITTQTTTASNEITALSNATFTNTANITTLSNSLTSTNTALTNYSNYESGRVASLSNFAYSIQSSNSTTTIYTSNITTKTIKADDGGNIGALLMSAAGLALGGYNLFNNQGQLTGTIQDALGKLKLNPSGAVELQSLLGKVGQYTDSVQVGVSTIEMSNNTIYFKDGNTSNTLITSNAITIVNNSINAFTVSNANLVTNCNIVGTNITSMSNVAYWASNNNINRNNETITVFNTDKILLPASANLIGSGWDYTLSGWTPLGATGGYVLRNGGGSLEIFTGASNNLNMAITITSNANVGVGTYFPTEKLDVNGNIKAGGSLDIGSSTTLRGQTYITGDIYKDIPNYDASWGDYSQLTISTTNNVVGGAWLGQLKLGFTNCNNIGFIQTINPWIVTPSLVLQPTGGSVGIGMSNPLAKLHVGGDVRVRSHIYAFDDVSSNPPMIITGASNYSWYGIQADYDNGLSIGSYAGSGIQKNNLYVQKSGRVGINNSNPQYTLDVTGNTRLNNALIGDAGHGNTWSAFAHSNSFTVGGYALLQNNTGRTLLNCALGQSMNFRINNVDNGVWNATGLGVGTVAPAHKLDVVGNVNATSYSGGTINSLSNLGMWSSNTARYSSNTAVWSSNLATDTYYKAEWTSNSLESPTVTDLSVTGNATFKAGLHAAAGTYTHLPFSGGFTNNLKNFVRGTTIFADTSNAEKVGIGLTNPTEKFQVEGTSLLKELIVGSLGNLITHIGIQEATIAGSGGGSKTITTFSGTYPSYYTVFPTVETQSIYDDVFCCSIQSKSTSQIKVITCRADGGGSWSQSITLKILVVGI